LPAGFVFALCLFFFLPMPRPVQKLFRIVKAPFQPYLTLEEAEALDAAAAAGDKVDEDEDAKRTDDAAALVPLWRSVVMSGIGVAQTLVWLGTGSFQLFRESSNTWDGLRSILVSFSWIYAAVRPVANPKATPHADLFSLYLIHLVSGILLLGGVIYDHDVFGDPLPPTLVVVALSVNVIALFVLLAVVVQVPLAVPSKRVNKKDIVSARSSNVFVRWIDNLNVLQGISVSPEDYTPLWKWITFRWIHPLIRRVCIAFGSSLRSPNYANCRRVRMQL
jgi:hypothetical protein